MPRPTSSDLWRRLMAFALIPFLISIPVALIGVTPIVVDAATGAWHELSPAEVMVDFD